LKTRGFARPTRRSLPYSVPDSVPESRSELIPQHPAGRRLLHRTPRLRGRHGKRILFRLVGMRRLSLSDEAK
jgi:hypothetical protein